MLSELVSYDFLGSADGYLHPDDDLLWKELDVELTGGWTVQPLLFANGVCDGGWPESKEGIGETLAGIVDGNRYFLSPELYMGSL